MLLSNIIKHLRRDDPTLFGTSPVDNDDARKTFINIQYGVHGILPCFHVRSSRQPARRFYVLSKELAHANKNGVCCVGEGEGGVH